MNNHINHLYSITTVIIINVIIINIIIGTIIIILLYSILNYTALNYTILYRLGRLLRERLDRYRMTLGTNLAGLRFMSRQIQLSKDERMSALELYGPTQTSMQQGIKALKKKGKSGEKVKRKRMAVSMSDVTEGMDEDDE